jgi:antitoxin component YwqK of YwqJK toxin-antitoxin module
MLRRSMSERATAEQPIRSVRAWDGEGFWARCRELLLPIELAEVDVIEWSALQSCYDARAIPLLFRALTAPDATFRFLAIQRLDDELIHQGSVWECTKPALRLLALLHDASSLERDVDWIFATMRQPGLWALVPQAFRKQHAEQKPEPLAVRWQDGLGREETGARTGEEIDGEPLRWYRSYHANGALALEGAYLRALHVEHGEWAQLASDGRVLASYVMDRGTGVRLRCHPSGQRKSSTELRDGLKHGLDQHWDEDGHLLEAARYEGGTLHGQAHDFHPDGSYRHERYYEAGNAHGTFKSWDAEGRLICERPFVRGVLHGTVCNYENGVKREEIAYRRGKRHGPTRRFDANGALEKTTEWKQGKPVLGKAS